jgi:hypothetical protein
MVIYIHQDISAPLDFPLSWTLNTAEYHGTQYFSIVDLIMGGILSVVG